MDELTMRVRVAERKFLRWVWGAFPAAGLAVAMLTGGGFWAWVDGRTPWLDWRQAFTVRGTVLAGAGLAAAGVWWALLGRRWSGWMVALVGLMGFVGVECAMRIPAVQTTFWLAMRARTYSDEWILKEIVSTQFRKLEGRIENVPGVVICGSSQTIGMGIKLAREIAPTPCVRRCSAGLMPLNILQMWQWIPFQKGDICIQYRSEFDFMDQEVLGLSWYRAYDSWKSLPDLIKVLGWKDSAGNWRKLTDHILAATLEGWRLKDAASELCKRWWGLEKNGKSIPPVWPKPAYRMEWSPWQQRAFERVAEKLQNIGVEMWVFEGDVNPRLHTKTWLARRVQIEQWMHRKSEEGLWRWIGVEEHDAKLDENDWKDELHPNENGTAKMVHSMVRMLQQASIVTSCKEQEAQFESHAKE